MANESTTPHFGLRDFLIFFVPGGVLLAGLLLLAGVSLVALKTHGFDGIATSIAGIIAAFYLGHISYGTTFLLRRIFNRYTGCDEFSQAFQLDYMACIENHPRIYTSEVTRYRAIARHCLAMVFPTLILGCGATLRVLSSPFLWVLAIAVATVFAEITFIYRYIRYSKIWKQHVELCKKL